MDISSNIDVETLLAKAQDAVHVRRVFGEPIERDGAMIIPAAFVAGGAGGGSGTSPDDEGSGSGSGAGYGVAAKPSGVYVVRGDQVEWHPAVNKERLALAGIALAAVTVLTIGRVLRRR